MKVKHNCKKCKFWSEYYKSRSEECKSKSKKFKFLSEEYKFLSKEYKFLSEKCKYWSEQYASWSEECKSWSEEYAKECQCEVKAGSQFESDTPDTLSSKSHPANMFGEQFYYYKGEDVKEFIKKIEDYIDIKLSQTDKESSLCQLCSETEYCENHMILYRRIEEIFDFLQERAGKELVDD